MHGTTKGCSRCGVDKPSDDFYKIRGGPALSSYCKSCFSDIAKARRKNREVAKKDDLVHAAWADRNKERLRLAANEKYRDKREILGPNPDAGRLLQKNFGISLDEYDALLEYQHGRCSGCGAENKSDKRDGSGIRLAVDHDHGTGVIRGLLCSRCNVSLGSLGDSVTVLMSLVKHLLFPPAVELWGQRKVPN